MVEKLKLYKIIMSDMFRNEKLLNYVTPSENAARERWNKEYENSSWRLDSIAEIDQIDGYKISFLEKILDKNK